MNENKTIIIFLLVFVLLMYVIFFTYIIVRYVIGSKNNNSIQEVSSKDVPISQSLILSSNPSNTDFYNKSVEHAQKVLFGKEFDPQYGQANYYGNTLIDVISKLNTETKDSTVVAMKYFSVEPSQARQNEQTFRMMAERESVPLWFVILREAVKKAVPQFSQSVSTPANTASNIVPLYQQTG